MLHSCGFIDLARVIRTKVATTPHRARMFARACGYSAVTLKSRQIYDIVRVNRGIHARFLVLTCRDGMARKGAPADAGLPLAWLGWMQRFA